MNVRKTGPSKATVALLEAREAHGGQSCECCGLGAREQIHHRKARGMGGTRLDSINATSNLFFICHQCHADIESSRSLSLGMGWLVRNAANPASIPVLYQGVFCFLDDMGGVTVADQNN